MYFAMNRVLVTSFLGLAPGIAAAQSNSIESRATGGTQATGASTLNFTGNAMSADGRAIAFGSYATNLTATDNNGQIDVFLRDRVADVTTCCSLNSTGKTGNSYSQYRPQPTVVTSRSSLASDLVANDHNGCSDVMSRLGDRHARASARRAAAPRELRRAIPPRSAPTDATCSRASPPTSARATPNKANRRTCVPSSAPPPW
jgi:hypothetical protein